MFSDRFLICCDNTLYGGYLLMTYLDKKNVADVDVSGKKVLVRVDFNVPMKDGVIKDDTRIRAALPTINYLLEHNAAVILMSHLGRPKGQVKQELSLAPVARRLADIMGKEIAFAADCVGEPARTSAADLKCGNILLLENLRFHPEEEKNVPEFGQELASIADIYVNDAFGAAHRGHASTEGVTHFLPAVGGFLIDKEIKALGVAISEPKRPYVAIIGGAKISDKILVIENLIKRVDKLLIGGGMANTFLAAAGYDMQKSLVEGERLDWAKDFLATDAAKEKLLLPVDLTAAAAFEADAEYKICGLNDIPEGWMSLDVGPRTMEIFTEAVKDAGTIVWNGPLGVFEMDAFAKGTVEMAEALADSDAFTIIGGGDSVSAAHKAGVADKISHISTGGGASLEFLQGKILPGVNALADK